MSARPADELWQEAVRLMEAKDPAALRPLEHLVALEAENADYQCGLAACYLMLGRAADAEAAFWRALSVDPQRGSAREGLARARAQRQGRAAAESAPPSGHRPTDQSADDLIRQILQAATDEPRLPQAAAPPRPPDEGSLRLSATASDDVGDLVVNPFDLHAQWRLSRVAGPEVVPALLRGLAVATAAEPVKCLYAILGKATQRVGPSADVVPALLQGMASPHADVRTQAAGLLVRYAGTDFSGQFIQLLQDRDWRARAIAVVGLGKCAGRGAATALGDALSGKVSGPSATVLPHERSWDAIASLTGVPELAGLGAQAVHLPTLAAWALGTAGDSAGVPFLLRALRNPDTHPRRYLEAVAAGFFEVAVAALVRLAGREARSRLVDLLSEKEAQVRAAAAIALGRTDAVAHLPHLLPLLQDRDVSVRIAAALGVTRAHRTEGWPILQDAFRIRLLAVPDRVKQWACEGLMLAALAGDEQALHKLQTMLPRSRTEVEPSARVASRGIVAAVMSLDAVELRDVLSQPRFALPDFVALLRLLRNVPDATVATVVAMLEAALPAAAHQPSTNKEGAASQTGILLSRLRREQDLEAALTLGRSGDGGAEGPLLRWLRESEPAREKVLVCLALDGCGGPASLPYLLVAAGDAIADVATAARGALAGVARRHPAEADSQICQALISAWHGSSSLLLRSALVQAFAALKLGDSGPLLAHDLLTVYGTGPFAKYRALLATALTELGETDALRWFHEAGGGSAAHWPEAVASAGVPVRSASGADTAEAAMWRDQAVKAWQERERAALANEDLSPYSSVIPLADLGGHALIPTCALCRGAPEFRQEVTATYRSTRVEASARLGVFVCRYCKDTLAPVVLEFLSETTRSWTVGFVNGGYGDLLRDSCTTAMLHASGRIIL